MGMGRTWSKEDLKYLKENYYDKDIGGIAIKLNRSYEAIKSQAFKKGIKRNPRSPETTKRNLENNPMNNLETRKKAVESRIKNGTYLKASIRMKENNPSKGGLTEEHKRKIGEASKRLWKRKDYKEKMLGVIANNIKRQTGVPNGVFKKLNQVPGFNEKRLKALIKKPTRPEQSIANLIKENNLPFNYVGDGQIFIGGFNPDFLSEELKKIIEVNGIYWHNLPQNKSRDIYKYENYRRKGYKTLIIWENEIKDKDSCLNKIKTFMED